MLLSKWYNTGGGNGDDNILNEKRREAATVRNRSSNCDFSTIAVA